MTLKQAYTEKQIDVFKQVLGRDWFICLLHGAKRSGKTKINNDLFLFELMRVRKIADQLGIKEPMYILAGVSSATIQKNVLQELYNIYGITPQFDKHNNFKLLGVKVVQAYTGNIGGVGAIRGMTSFGAYVNEASLARQEVFAEIISRCSGQGARILADTNPDSPEHWLKKEYIDKTNDNVLTFQFKLDDNTFLTERYRENIKAATPSGMFYDRDINGAWVSADGIVYQDFDEKIHYINSDDISGIKSYFAGVDWGYEHFGALILFGEDNNGNVYLLEEYAEQHKEIDYWLGVAKDIQDRFGKRVPFWCDSARPEYVDKFKSERIIAFNADKAILSGVEAVAKRIKTKRLFVCRDKVTRFKQEIYQYTWNEKTGLPNKEMDDCLDAVRYAIYNFDKSTKGNVRKRIKGL